MNHAIRNCIELKKPDGTTILRGDCLDCEQPQEVVVPTETWDKVKVMSRQQRPLIQDAFPSVPVGKREFMISGYCDDCFNRMFDAGDA